MKFETYLPAAVLRPFIKEYKIIESDEEAVNRILPDTSIAMAFRFNMPAVNGVSGSVPLSVVTGISESLRHIRYAKGVQTLIVLFSETGAAAFFNQPLHILYGSHTSLDNLLPHAITSEIESKLQEAPSSLQKIAVIETFLLGILASREIDLAINFAIQKIKDNNGLVNIKELARSLNTSIDPFEKRFRKITGTTPKHFSTIIKLRHSIDAYSASDNLTDLAYQVGYFDQSHFIKDFKRFTGQTPTNFFKSGEFW